MPSGSLTIAQAIARALNCHKSGNFSEAEAIYRQILTVQPDEPETLHLLGVLEQQAGQSEEASKHVARAVALNPLHTAAHSNLGAIYKTLGRWPEAQACYERALALDPVFVDALTNLGSLLLQTARPDAARAYFERALAVQPDNALAHFNLGVLLEKMGRQESALPHLERAAALWPGHPAGHYNLGIVLFALHRLREARERFQRALELEPGNAPAQDYLALVHKGLGEMDAAVEAHRRALAFQPDTMEFRSNLIQNLLCRPGTTSALLRAECEIWNRRHALPLRGAIRPPLNVPDSARRLKIGYVSPDFRDHAVSHFIAPLLAAHDRAHFEVHAYASVPRPDALTARLRGLVDGWHDVATFSDGALADQIRADGIDVLIDMTLHSANHRLLAFARRPAPVQVSWLGYAGTSGLDRIDYRLTDAYLDPPDAGDDAAWSAEAPVRLPDSWCCYEPGPDFPSVGGLPALQPGAAGSLTFGALNQFSKTNPRVLRLWAQVLVATPGARLLLHCPDPVAYPPVLEIMAQANVDAARVEFVPRLSKLAYLQLYRDRVDVALDPFPFNGMTTTCEALWMGVPVVTLPDVLPVSRTGLSLLTTVGLPKLVARDEADYARIAVDLAGDLPRLAALRAGLRARLQASPLMDAPGFARHVETAYRAMWQRWCEKQGRDGCPSRP